MSEMSRLAGPASAAGGGFEALVFSHRAEVIILRSIGSSSNYTSYKQ